MPVTPMFVYEYIRDCKQRRREILNELPPKLRRELIILNVQIRNLRKAEKEKREAREAVAKSLNRNRRKPLVEHRVKLIDFLRGHGPTALKDIIAKTGIPRGSMREVLKDDAFTQPSRGVFDIVAGMKKPGPSATSQ